MYSETEQLFAMIDGSFDGMLLVDRSGQILISNAAFCDRLGYDRRAVPGTNVQDYIPTGKVHEHESNMNGWWRRPKTRMMGGGPELRILRSDGRAEPVNIGLGVGVTRTRTFAVVTVRWLSDA